MAKIGYREIAKEHLERAQEWLSSDDPRAPSYACLELRFCLEAITYARAQAYLELTENKIVEQWQPPKIIEELKELDPHVDISATLSIRADHEEDWQTIGEDKRLSLRWVRKQYHALGSFVHQPTLRQFQTGQIPSNADILAKAAAVAKELSEALASTLFDMVFHHTVTFKCRCGFAIARHIGMKADNFEATCPQCGDIYRCHCGTSSDVTVVPLDFRIRCPSCSAENRFNKKVLTREDVRHECANCPHGIVFYRGWHFRPDNKVEPSMSRTVVG